MRKPSKGRAAKAETSKSLASSEPSSGNVGAGQSNGQSSKGAPETVFGKPAPEGAAKKVSEVLGEIVWLMSQSPLHKQLFIADLE